MKQELNLHNIDAAILSVAQLIQPCDPEGLVKQTKLMLKHLKLDKRQIASRIKAMLQEGYLWSRSDKMLLLTPRGYDIGQASLSSKDRDKFRLLLLNKAHYK